RARQNVMARASTETAAAGIAGSRVAESGMPEPSRPSRPVDPPTISGGKQLIKYAYARDGTRIAYTVTGSGPPIVRASHWMSHLEFDWESPVWGHWIDALSSSFTLLRYDGRLNGLSDTDCK